MSVIARRSAFAPGTGARTSSPRRASSPVTGTARAKLRTRAVELYQPVGDSAEPPLSIRAIAALLERSYGLAWNLLNEAGVQRRPAHGHKHPTR